MHWLFCCDVPLWSKQELLNKYVYAYTLCWCCTCYFFHQRTPVKSEILSYQPNYCFCCYFFLEQKVNAKIDLSFLLLFLFLLGVCQQQNVLFDFMTVKEHLEFYAGLKEVDMEERDDVVT